MRLGSEILSSSWSRHGRGRWARRRTLGSLWLLCWALLALNSGCIGAGLLTDGTSVSGGTFNNGYLRGGRRMPPQGDGYVIPQLWQDRGANFATDEMIAAIRRAAKRVAKEYPGAILGVADLSIPGGGESPLHRSHENGHDADLIWYALDENNKPVAPADSMPAYGRDLWAKPPHPTPNVVFGPYTPRRFDVRRNWALVRALLSDPDIEVQYMFVHARLRNLLLHEGQRLHDDEELLDRAEALMKQPGDSLPHDDHLHLRIYCSPSDRALGCRDYGPLRYWRKRYKYMPPAPHPDLGSRRLAKLFSKSLPRNMQIGTTGATLTATSGQ